MIIIIVNLLKYKNVSAAAAAQHTLEGLQGGAGGMIPIKGSSCSSLLVAAAMSCVGGWGRRPFSFPCVFLRPKLLTVYYLTVAVAEE